MRFAAPVLALSVSACSAGVDGLFPRDRPADAAPIETRKDASSEPDASELDAGFARDVDSPDASPPDTGELPPCDLRFEHVSPTSWSTCAVTKSGKIGCWGRPFEPAELVPPEGSFTKISGGYRLRCAIRTNGELACWGPNTAGQASPPSGRFLDVSAGEYNACGVREDGTLACWGGNDGGIWDFGQSRPPQGIYRTVSVGQYIVCAVRDDREIVCWGDPASHLNPAPQGPWAQVFAGLYHACARAEDGRVQCWGGIDHLRPPAPEDRMRTFSFGFHSLNDVHWCGLRFDRTIACGGTNDYHQTEPPPGQFAEVEVGGRHSCAIDLAGELICWGDNYNGQLGPPPDDLFAPPPECTK